MYALARKAPKIRLENDMVELIPSQEAVMQILKRFAKVTLFTRTRSTRHITFKCRSRFATTTPRAYWQWR
jgi:hypothetical protein